MRESARPFAVHDWLWIGRGIVLSQDASVMKTKLLQCG